MPVWAVEWSAEQNAFHIDLLERVLKINQRTAAEGEKPGYIILAITRTHEESRAFCDCWRREHLKEAVE